MNSKTEIDRLYETVQMVVNDNFRLSNEISELKGQISKIPIQFNLQDILVPIKKEYMKEFLTIREKYELPPYPTKTLALFEKTVYIFNNEMIKKFEECTTVSKIIETLDEFYGIFKINFALHMFIQAKTNKRHDQIFNWVLVNSTAQKVRFQIFSANRELLPFETYEKNDEFCRDLYCNGINFNLVS
jgi:hypothetical protein